MSAVDQVEGQQQPGEQPDDDDEAEAAEGEQPTPEPEPEPEPEARGVTAADVDALDRENTRHEKAVARIMGEDFRFVAACPTCQAFGFIWPPPPEERPEYREHSITKRCATCGGLGDVKTGSLRAGNELIRCADCKGYGYQPNPATAPATFTDAPATPAPSGGAELAPAGASPAPETPVSEDPRVAELRAAGFIVMPPVQQAAPTY